MKLFIDTRNLGIILYYKSDIMNHILDGTTMEKLRVLTYIKAVHYIINALMNVKNKPENGAMENRTVKTY